MIQAVLTTQLFFLTKHKKILLIYKHQEKGLQATIPQMLPQPDYKLQT